MRNVWAAFLVAQCAAPALAADAEDPRPTRPPVRRKAGSSVEITPYTGGSFVVRTVNKTYDFVDPFDGGDGLLLSQEIEAKYARPPGEGWETAAVRVTAFDVSPSGKLQKRYEVIEAGQAGRLLDRHRYQISLSGACDALNALVVYSAWTGKPILYASGSNSEDGLVHFRLPDASPPSTGQERWLGVYTSNAPYDDAVFGAGGQGQRAMVTYAAMQAPIARALVEFGTGDTAQHEVKKIEVKPGPLVHIEMGGDIAIDIPIKDDKLDIGRAKLPAWATAKPLPAQWPNKPVRRTK